ncbi:MarR family transcriptional regulator [[Brevibacterium] frigoritolerans]|nr:MarR family transcriptional regulator [Peribacillus frigoritolerans]
MSEDPRQLKIGTIKPEDLFDRAVRFQLAVTVNPDISLKNKALMLLIDTYDGKITIEEILRLTSDGKSSISAGLKELEQSGYIKRKRERDDKGVYLPTQYELALYTPEFIKNARENWEKHKKQNYVDSPV